MPQPTARNRAAMEADAIRPDAVGNALLTAGGSGALKAGAELGESAVEPAASSIADAGEQAVQAAKNTAENAFRNVKGLSSDAVQAVQQLVKAHPQAAKVLGKVLLSGAVGGDLGHSARSAILGAMLGGIL